MKAKKELIWVIVAFLLLIPFRLPISVILIRLFNDIAQLEGTKLSFEILQANVVLTKIVYNLVFSSIFIYNIEHLSRKLMGKKPYADVYISTAIIGFIMFIYSCFDAYWISELFKFIH